jgi:hypothetical protein
MGFLRDIDIVQLVLPVKHHRISVDFIEILIDSISQFLLGFNPYTPEHLFGHFAEKPFHHTELLDQGIPAERILKYGFTFKGKECLIRKG